MKKLEKNQQLDSEDKTALDDFVRNLQKLADQNVQIFHKGIPDSKKLKNDVLRTSILHKLSQNMNF